MSDEQERAAFEAWGRAEGLEDKAIGRGMDYPLGEHLWRAWQAGRAALAAAPQVPAVQAESTGDLLFSTAAMQKRHAEYVGRVVSTLEDIKREHLGQQDLAEKSSRNARVQARYDELMQAGKHGHYETMFRVVREEVERVSGAPQPAERVPLTVPQILELMPDKVPASYDGQLLDFARAIEAAHGIRAAGVKGTVTPT